MRSGMWFSFGLVLATTGAVLWSVLGGPWLRWLFHRDVGGYR